MTHGAPSPYAVIEEPYKVFYFGKRALKLPKLHVDEHTTIYVLNILGGKASDIEYFAKELLHAYAQAIGMVEAIVTPEGKAIHLAYEVARQADKPYIVLRKECKPYMGKEPMKVNTRTYTTQGEQLLALDNKDLDAVRGCNFVFVDDVISTGRTLYGACNLIDQAGGAIKAALVMATEGDYYYTRTVPVVSLGHLSIERE